MIQFFRNLILNGTPESSMRFVAVHSVLLTSIIWAVVCLWRLEIVDIPSGVVAFIAVAVAGKATEKFAERKPHDG
jgi:hypothetical protein